MFKVGDLVECQEFWGNVLTKGKKYTVIDVDEKYIEVKNNHGENCNYFKSRFKLAEPILKVGDKVKLKNNTSNIWQIAQIHDKIAFIKDETKFLNSVELSDLEKVEEKTAPPKFTKVYVWDGQERPSHPRMCYSYGEINGGKLRVFCASLYIECEYYYENWEIIV